MIRVILAAAFAVAIAFGALPASSQERYPTGANILVRSSYAPGYCLDASLDRSRDGRVVYIYQCHGRYNQRWMFTQGEDGSSAVVAFDGRCLDIRGAQRQDGARAQLWRCHYGTNQQFTYTSGGLLRERQSGKCLTIHNSVGDRREVFIDDCDGNTAQRWTLQR